MTLFSFGDDGSLMKEYFNKVSKQILENSSRNRRAESMSNQMNANSVRMKDLNHTDEIIGCAGIDRTSIENAQDLCDKWLGEDIGVW